MKTKTPSIYNPTPTPNPNPNPNHNHIYIYQCRQITHVDILKYLCQRELGAKKSFVSEVVVADVWKLQQHARTL